MGNTWIKAWMNQARRSSESSWCWLLLQKPMDRTAGWSPCKPGSATACSCALSLVVARTSGVGKCAPLRPHALFPPTSHLIRLKKKGWSKKAWVESQIHHSLQGHLGATKAHLSNVNDCLDSKGYCKAQIKTQLTALLCTFVFRDSSRLLRI